MLHCSQFQHVSVAVTFASTNSTPPLTSCSYGTAALARSPSPLPKHTHTYPDAQECLPSALHSYTPVLFVLALFWMLSVCEDMHARVCQTDSSIETPTFLAPPRQSSGEWWLKPKWAFISLSFSLPVSNRHHGEEAFHPAGCTFLCT